MQLKGVSVTHSETESASEGGLGINWNQRSANPSKENKLNVSGTHSVCDYCDVLQ